MKRKQRTANQEVVTAFVSAVNVRPSSGISLWVEFRPSAKVRRELAAALAAALTEMVAMIFRSRKLREG